MSISSNKTTFDCIIVGAGVTGLTMALSAAALGLQVCVVESKQSQSFQVDWHDPRVFALNPASIHVFENLEVWEDMQALRVSPYQRMLVWDKMGDGQIHFDAQKKGEPILGAIVEQQVLLDALLNKLNQTDGIELKTEQSIQHIDVERGGVYLGADDRLNATFVIGADGANSYVRQQAGIRIQSKPYRQRAVVARLQCEHPHQMTAYQCFHSTGPVALLPLKHSHQVSLVWSMDESFADEVMQLKDDDFIVQLQNHCESMLGKMTLLDSRHSFNLKKQLADRYWSDSCVLVGDAAHVIHPLAGQGLNLGLMDVASLYDILKQWRDSGKFLQARLLNQYQRQRRAHAQAIGLAMDAFYHGFKSRQLAAIALRNWGISQVDSNLSIKNLFTDVALGRIGFTIPYLGRIKHASQKPRALNTTNILS